MDYLIREIRNQVLYSHLLELLVESTLGYLSLQQSVEIISRHEQLLLITLYLLLLRNLLLILGRLRFTFQCLRDLQTVPAFVTWLSHMNGTLLVLGQSEVGFINGELRSSVHHFLPDFLDLEYKRDYTYCWLIWTAVYPFIYIL